LGYFISPHPHAVTLGLDPRALHFHFRHISVVGSGPGIMTAPEHPTINIPSTNPNTSLTKPAQSPLIPLHPLDKNKGGTYKNNIATRETEMLTFLKDAAAFVTLGAFTIGSLTWMDLLTRLV
jgi:hypothetical protein